MKIEFLYFEDCPNSIPALEVLQNVVGKEGLDVAIEKVRVDSVSMTENVRFLGSPSIKVDGEDIEPGSDSGNYGMNCRVYSGFAGLGGIPSEDLIRLALKKAAG